MHTHRCGYLKVCGCAGKEGHSTGREAVRKEGGSAVVVAERAGARCHGGMPGHTRSIIEPTAASQGGLMIRCLILCVKERLDFVCVAQLAAFYLHVFMACVSLDRAAVLLERS